jgi:hypothetical protein
MGFDHLMVASSSLLSTLTWTLIPLSGNVGLVPGSTEQRRDRRRKCARRSIKRDQPHGRLGPHTTPITIEALTMEFDHEIHRVVVVVSGPVTTKASRRAAPAAGYCHSDSLARPLDQCRRRVHDDFVRADHNRASNQKHH